MGQSCKAGAHAVALLHLCMLGLCTQIPNVYTKFIVICDGWVTTWLHTCFLRLLRRAKFEGQVWLGLFICGVCLD